MAREKVYTRTGDDGTTGLLYGGRVRKDSELPTAYGAVDEAQAVLGLARAEAGLGSELANVIVGLERDLYVLMAELATLPENRSKLKPGVAAVTAAMVDAARAPDRRHVRTVRAADRVRRAGRDEGGGAARRRPHRRAPGRAPRPRRRRAAVARGDVPQPPVRSALDPRPLARGSLVVVPPVGKELMAITFDTAVTRPRTADVVGIPVTADGPTPRGALTRRELAHARLPRHARHHRGGARSDRTWAWATAPPSPLPCCARRRPRWRVPRRHVGVVATALGRRRRRRPAGRRPGGGRGLRARLVPVPRVEAQGHAHRGRAGGAPRPGGVGGGTRRRRRTGRRHRRRRELRARPRQHPARPPDGTRPGRRGPRPRDGRPGSRSRCSTRTASGAAPRRPPRGEPGLDRAAPPGEAHLHAPPPDRHRRARGQGHHLRLGRHLAEAVRRHARRHEDGHERRRRRAGGDDGAAGHEAAR